MKYTLTLLTALLLAPLAALHAADAPKPNVVYLLADDLGWSDISAHPGGSIQTPNIDRLFKQGVELRNFMGWGRTGSNRGRTGDTHGVEGEQEGEQGTPTGSNRGHPQIKLTDAAIAIVASGLVSFL